MALVKKFLLYVYYRKEIEQELFQLEKNYSKFQSFYENC